MHGISKAFSTYLVNVKSCDYLVKSDVEIVQEIYNLHSKEDMVNELHYYMARRDCGKSGLFDWMLLGWYFSLRTVSTKHHVLPLPRANITHCDPYTR